MRTFKFLFAILLTGAVFMSCNNDDDSTPAPVNEEEVITTMTVTLTPTTTGNTVTLRTQDLDGPDGPNAPDVTVVGELVAGTTYNGTIEFLNETESPAEDITEEVEEEDEEHQVFYIPGTALDATIAYSDEDADGNPVGLAFTLTANSAGTGSLTVVLRHEPNKPNDGTLSDAGGETDISESFTVTIQ